MTPGYNAFEGALALKDGNVWYYFAGTPAIEASHHTKSGGSIALCRAYVTHCTGKQEWFYNDEDGERAGTGDYEDLPPEP